MSKYEAVLGRKLTDEERAKLTAAEEQSKADTKRDRSAPSGTVYTKPGVVSTENGTYEPPPYSQAVPRSVVQLPFHGPLAATGAEKYFQAPAVKHTVVGETLPAQPPSPIVPVAAPPSMSPTGLQPSSASVPMTTYGASQAQPAPAPEPTRMEAYDAGTAGYATEDGYITRGADDPATLGTYGLVTGHADRVLGPIWGPVAAAPLSGLNDRHTQTTIGETLAKKKSK